MSTNFLTEIRKLSPEDVAVEIERDTIRKWPNGKGIEWDIVGTPEQPIRRISFGETHEGILRLVAVSMISGGEWPAYNPVRLVEAVNFLELAKASKIDPELTEELQRQVAGVLHLALEIIE